LRDRRSPLFMYVQRLSEKGLRTSRRGLNPQESAEFIAV
jgi:hypothetical protein